MAKYACPDHPTEELYTCGECMPADWMDTVKRRAHRAEECDECGGWFPFSISMSTMAWPDYVVPPERGGERFNLANVRYVHRACTHAEKARAGKGRKARANVGDHVLGWHSPTACPVPERHDTDCNQPTKTASAS